MPELNLHYAETPPWLRNDAQESHFLSDAERGFKLSQEQKLAPLRQREAEQHLRAREQDFALSQIKLEEALRLRDETLASEVAAQELAQGEIPQLLRAGKV